MVLSHEMSGNGGISFPTGPMIVFVSAAAIFYFPAFFRLEEGFFFAL